MIKTLSRLSDFLSKGSTPGLPLEEATYVVFDTELTGLDLKKDSILSIGAVRMMGSSISLGETFYKLLSPSTEIQHKGVVIHGITPSDVEGKPLIDTVLQEFIDFAGDAIMVGHFVTIDMGFISREVRRVCAAAFQNPAVDTYRIYEWIRENTGSFSRHYERRTEELNLFSIAREYNIPISEGHNALSDAFITAQLFQRFLGILPGLGVRTTRDLVKIGRP